MTFDQELARLYALQSCHDIAIFWLTLVWIAQMRATYGGDD